MEVNSIIIFFFPIFIYVNSESVFVGERIFGDKLIHRSEHVKIPFYFIRTSDVAFPKYYEDSDNVITAIHVIDNSEEGGTAEVDYGGVGLKYANVHLRSALWSGFNFTVDIYGIKVD
ncbi:unnamed protein product [Euphydryas editha]|uniref:Uncharacterized protein n=1 Tax=Euphydryas editha TaxID=104508 RepID=A0AAU9UHB6_EUPED|nr:unnamed protein product [Euphydryas editha]